MTRRRTRTIAALLAVILGLGSPLGVAGSETVLFQPGLTDAEQAMLARNPALAELAAVAPERLREVLDGIADALAHPSTTRGGLDQLDAETVRLFGENPALLQAWRSSPEASADLLELIRLAAGGGKPKK